MPTCPGEFLSEPYLQVPLIMELCRIVNKIRLFQLIDPGLETMVFNKQLPVLPGNMCIDCEQPAEQIRFP